MKFVKAMACIGIGYLSAVAYYTICILVHKKPYWGDYVSVLFYCAFIGVTTMLVIFLIPYLVSTGTSFFWKPAFCGTVGAILGFLVLYWLYPELARHYMLGGQAAIMSGVTFALGARTLRKPNKELEPTG